VQERGIPMNKSQRPARGFWDWFWGGGGSGNGGVKG
jgi:hypothetical protein